MRRAARERVETAALLAPSVVLLAVFVLLPLCIVAAYSFALRDPYGAVLPGFTFDNYAELFQGVYLLVFVNSFKLAAATTVLCLLIGYPVAYYIAFKAGRAAPALLLLLLIPFWINFLIRISAWVVLLGRGGLVNGALQASGLTDAPLGLLNTLGATLVGMVYAFLPLTVFPIYAALQPIDRRLLEAGADLGAGPAETFWRVTLPLSLPGVLAAALFVFVPSMGVFAIPVLLGGGKDIILGNLIVQLFLEFRNIPLGAAVSMLLLALSGLGILAYMRALRRVEAMR
ncbi:ABC transporter permease [Rhodobacter sp. Har01]|uniref:ABC transporter permease n=1 Tax=Rhodobacter sp. Har01 TaxID=2883999 RepID=UPI001D084405|nr:ABC transporter permease [Rhodobacter sp. Har01]MCB6179085.1 ABC transporter permease [Rhodobacter sp. Har01]